MRVCLFTVNIRTVMKTTDATDDLIIFRRFYPLNVFFFLKHKGQNKTRQQVRMLELAENLFFLK